MQELDQTTFGRLTHSNDVVSLSKVARSSRSIEIYEAKLSVRKQRNADD
jgi:hypothetical protein